MKFIYKCMTIGRAYSNMSLTSDKLFALATGYDLDSKKDAEKAYKKGFPLAFVNDEGEYDFDLEAWENEVVKEEDDEEPEEKLERIINESRLTINELAMLTDISNKTLKSWLNGRNKPKEYVVDLIEFKLKTLGYLKDKDNE